ncbi:MAG: nitroreductase family protein, partial [Candidatus Phytoplasma australasiaticum]|nr:nitroreductase family protein [Candidatus Phytoplasma australasiaticum]
MKIKTIRSFDPNYQISKEIWKKIFNEIRVTPSSFDLHPWHFFISCTSGHKKKVQNYLMGTLEPSRWVGGRGG